jgi:hypothetical protein
MKPSKETIQKFRQAYREEIGKEMTADEAYDELNNLVELLKVVLGPKLLRKLNKTDEILEFDENFENDKIDKTNKFS